jgi:hypothetical protein
MYNTINQLLFNFKIKKFLLKSRARCRTGSRKFGYIVRFKVYPDGKVEYISYFDKLEFTEDSSWP